MSTRATTASRSTRATAPSRSARATTASTSTRATAASRSTLATAASRSTVETIWSRSTWSSTSRVRSIRSTRAATRAGTQASSSTSTRRRSSSRSAPPLRARSSKTVAGWNRAGTNGGRHSIRVTGAATRCTVRTATTAAPAVTPATPRARSSASRASGPSWGATTGRPDGVRSLDTTRPCLSLACSRHRTVRRSHASVAAGKRGPRPPGRGERSALPAESAAGGTRPGRERAFAAGPGHRGCSAGGVSAGGVSAGRGTS